MPIYLHPASTTAKELRSFGICMAGPSFGFGVDVQYCFMRMIHRGVFDAFPNLKVILGHFGEAFPFLVNRVDTAYRQGFGKPSPEIGGYEKEPSYYVKRHMWTTSSGNYLPEALYCTRDAMGMDRIIMATDYPFEDMKPGPDMILKDVPNLSEREKRAYLHDNAKALGFGRAIE
jgi:predicted TIM-barrel fold metal-dependent hydrolase